jgi:integrase
MAKATKRPDHYKFTAGKRPFTLVAEERPDRDYEVYFRWQEPDPQTGASKPRYIATGLSVRDDRGRRRRHKEKEVEEAAEKAQAFYAAGGDPRKWNAATSPTGVPRTLAEGFAYALPSKADPAHVGAMYPTRDQTSLDARHAADYVEAHLGADTRWDELRPNCSTELWRACARAYKDGTGPGYRTAERAVSVLCRTWEFLRELYPEDIPAVQRPSRWNVKAKADWEKITGENIKNQRKRRRKELRYSEEEARFLLGNLAALDAEGKPLLDPRIRPILEIGAELRPGQVLRANRSQLDLSEGVGGFGLGRFNGEELGRGKKEGETVDLHPELRAYLDDLLGNGHLSLLEKAYRAGEISDYPLFPGGRPTDGKFTVEQVFRSEEPVRINKRTAIAAWNAFEKAVGVAHVDDRSFYGLRRILSDKANDYTTDDRVLNRMTGNTAETRKQYYLDKERDEDRAKAAEVRRRMRLDLAGGVEGAQTSVEEAETPEVPDVSLAAALGKLDPEARRKALELLGLLPPTTSNGDS